MLASCSNSNDNNDNPTIEDTILVLPKTKKYTTISHPEDNSITTYTYDENKIVSLDYSDDNKTTFTYTENVITKVESFDSRVLESTTAFTYENNKLKSYLKAPTTISSIFK